MGPLRRSGPIRLRPGARMGHPDGRHGRPGADVAARDERALDECLPLAALDDPGSSSTGASSRSGRTIGDVERARREPDRLPTADRTSFVPIRVRHGRAHPVAVEDRGDDAAVQDVPGTRHVLGPRMERRDRDLGIICRPPALEPEAGRVVGAAAPAVVERHQVLERIAGTVGRPYSHSIVPGGLEVMS
jgi:hypothetical protein